MKKNNKKIKKELGRVGRFFHTVFVCVLICAVIFGIGFSVKKIYYDKVGGGVMKTAEANRLIGYLGVADYAYNSKIGSSFKISDARKLADAAGVDRSAAQIPEYMPGFVPLTLKQFENTYTALITALQLDRLSAENIYIYNIDTANEEVVEGKTYYVIESSAGDFFMEKDYMMDSALIGKVASVYISNDEIILCQGMSNESALIRCAYVTGKAENDGELTVYVDGVKMALKTDSSYKSGMDIFPCLCDITITGDGITEVKDLTSSLEDAKVLAYSGGLVSIDGQKDPMYLSSSFNSYNIKGGVVPSKSAGTLIGYKKVKIYQENGELMAAVVDEDIEAKNIRVLISNSNYEGYYHNSFKFTSEDPFKVTYGSTEKDYNAGDVVELRTGNDEFDSGVVKIFSAVNGGRIEVISIDRQGGKPKYRGTLELTKESEGIKVVNELPLEEYLYGVVPSEMPVSYETEALKVQAMCARSYAYRAMSSDTYAEYGAHLDDSIQSQVYNNVEEEPRATYAVDDTYGVVPTFDTKVVEAYFFSTSCGTTANNADIWGGIQEPYLLDTEETELNQLVNFSDEIAFKNFIDGKVDGDFIEADEPFYRWQVGFTKEHFTETVNSKIYDRILNNPESVLVKDKNNKFVKKDISSVGDVVDVRVTKRGKSGVVKEIEIEGTEEVIKVIGQNNVRMVLSPENVQIKKQDGSVVTGWKSLPSPYFYIDTTSGVAIRGGGFGHGVGMSQNGANDLAKRGYLAPDIITHYYSGTELWNIYTKKNAEF